MDDYKYARRTYNCQCIKGDCMRFDEELCDVDINDLETDSHIMYMPVSGFHNAKHKPKPIIITANSKDTE